MKNLLALILAALTLGAMVRADGNFSVKRDPYGVVTTRVGELKDNAYAVIQQTDGKILAAGATFNGKDTDIAVIRYLVDGTIDTSFGDRGVAIYGSELGDDKGYAIAVTAEGKILVVGSSSNGKNTDFIAIRFYANGKLDKSFGRNGVCRKDFGRGDDVAYSIDIDRDGNLAIGGSASNGRDLDFAVWRLEEDGRPILKFGELGAATVNLGSQDSKGANEFGYAVVVQPDGKVVQAGYSEMEGVSVIATVRYDLKGKPDPTFGAGGIAVTEIGGRTDRAYAAVLQKDGKILVGGSASNGSYTRFALARYLPNGTHDPQFGERGVSTTSFGAGNDVIYSLSLDSQNRIVAAGSYFNGSDTGFAVARYTPSGNLDLSFGSNGKITTLIEQRYNAVYAVTVQRDGKILGAGVTTSETGYKFALARFQNDGSMDSTFGGAPQNALVARSKSNVPIQAGVGIFPNFDLGLSFDDNN